MPGEPETESLLARGALSTGPRAQNTVLARLSAESRLKSIAVAIGIFAILALRSRNALVLPTMAVEDGRDMLAFFFNDHSILGIFRLYGGYVSFIPHLLAWLCVGVLPLPAVPYAFTLASLIIASLGFYALSRPGHSWLIADSNHRSLLALTLAVLPLGKCFLITNLTYSQWSLLVLFLVLVTRRPLPSSRTGLSLWTLAAAACAVSNPLSILILPIVLMSLRACEHTRQRLSLGILVTVLVLYQAFWVNHSAVSVNLSFGSLGYAVQVFLARVIFEAFVGAREVNLLVMNGHAFYAYAGGVASLAALGYMSFTGRKNARGWLITSVAVLLGFAMVLMPVLTRYNTPEAKAIYLVQPALQRYFYLPKILTLVICASLLFPLQHKLTHGARAGVKLGLTVFVFAAYVVAITRRNAFLYESPREEGLRVKAFLASAYSDLAKARQGAPYEPIHTLPRQWADVVLDLDRHNGKRTVEDVPSIH